jgi:hypothetical protein
VKVSLSVTFHEAENDAVVRVYAHLRGLDVEYSSGDVDGRKWLQISAEVDEATLCAVIAEITKLPNTLPP